MMEQKKTYILNFGYRLPESVRCLFEPCEEIKVSVSLHPDRSPAPQIRFIVEGALKRLQDLGGSVEDVNSIVVRVPRVPEDVAVFLAELAGRIGKLPQVMVLRRSGETFVLLGNSSEVGVMDLEYIRRGAGKGAEKSGGGR